MLYPPGGIRCSVRHNSMNAQELAFVVRRADSAIPRAKRLHISGFCYSPPLKEADATPDSMALQLAINALIIKSLSRAEQVTRSVRSNMFRTRSTIEAPCICISPCCATPDARGREALRSAQNLT
jgi:hypothetical protein